MNCGVYNNRVWIQGEGMYGQGRDTIFFAYKDINMIAIDSSEVAINTLSKIATESKLQLTTMIHNPLEGISFDNSYFDAIYSHMFFNMRFTEDQLKYLGKVTQVYETMIA